MTLKECSCNVIASYSIQTNFGPTNGNETHYGQFESRENPITTL